MWCLLLDRIRWLAFTFDWLTDREINVFHFILFSSFSFCWNAKKPRPILGCVLDFNSIPDEKTVSLIGCQWWVWLAFKWSKFSQALGVMIHILWQRKNKTQPIFMEKNSNHLPIKMFSRWEWEPSGKNAENMQKIIFYSFIGWSWWASSLWIFSVFFYHSTLEYLGICCILWGIVIAGINFLYSKFFLIIESYSKCNYSLYSITLLHNHTRCRRRMKIWQFDFIRF